jgi:hypothetical protein
MPAAATQGVATAVAGGASPVDTPAANTITNPSVASPTASGGSGYSQSDKIALGCEISIPLALLIVAIIGIYIMVRRKKTPEDDT